MAKSHLNYLMMYTENFLNMCAYKSLKHLCAATEFAQPQLLPRIKESKLQELLLTSSKPKHSGRTPTRRRPCSRR